MGDYNIDLSKQNTNNKVTHYLNELHSAGCYSLINKPTRITDTSATTLGHIYSNSLHKISVSGVHISDISDHLPTFCVMTSNIQKNLTPKLMFRDMKKFNNEAFSEEISNSLESSFRNRENDPNVVIPKILNVITEITNKYGPLRKLSLKEVKSKTKPRLTKGLFKSISTKNKLFEQFFKKQKSHSFLKYKTYLNKLTKLKEIAKKIYQKKLQSHKDNVSKQWKIINEIICHKQLQNNCISMITDEQNCKITDKTKISDLLNDYFANVGPSLDAKIPAATKCFNFPSMLKSFVYDSITEDEVYLQIFQLNPNKAAGPENVPTKILRVLATIISPYLSDTLNKCYETGIFPNSLKIAKIIPVHKAKQKHISIVNSQEKY